VAAANKRATWTAEKRRNMRSAAPAGTDCPARHNLHFSQRRNFYLWINYD
jgi:hypothetical protein